MLLYSQNSSDTPAIVAHLQRCDHLFMPSLSSRINLFAYAQKIEQHAVRFECLYAGELIGLIAMYANDPTGVYAHITNVSLEQQFQGQGIAQKLLENAIAYTYQNHFSFINLQVNPKNSQAMKLYHKFGFATTTSASVDAVEMTLTLTKNETRL
jgi:ribosomal protein S18 acetylase RimI-like enzyme